MARLLVFASLAALTASAFGGGYGAMETPAPPPVAPPYEAPATTAAPTTAAPPPTEEGYGDGGAAAPADAPAEAAPPPPEAEAEEEEAAPMDMAKDDPMPSEPSMPAPPPPTGDDYEYIDIDELADIDLSNSDYYFVYEDGSPVPLRKSRRRNTNRRVKKVRKVKRARRTFRLKRPSEADIGLKFNKRCRDMSAKCGFLASVAAVKKQGRTIPVNYCAKRAIRAQCQRACDICTPNLVEWKLRRRNGLVLRRRRLRRIVKKRNL